ncbi:MAG: hypothetical protein AAF518_18240 [Spirochaetota bacterium]
MLETKAKISLKQRKSYAEILEEKGTKVDFSDMYWVQKRLDAIDVEKDYAEFVGLIINLIVFPMSHVFPYVYASNSSMGVLMHQSYDYITYRKGRGTMVTNAEKRNSDQIFFVLQFLDHRLTKEAKKICFDKVNFLHTKYPGITNYKMLITTAFFTVGMPLVWQNALGEKEAKHFPYFGRFTRKFEQAIHLLWQEIAEGLGISNPPNSYEECLDLVFGKEGFLNTIDTNYSEASHSLLTHMFADSARALSKIYPFVAKDFFLHLLYATVDKRAMQRAGIKAKNQWFYNAILKSLAHGLRFSVENLPATKWQEPDYNFSSVVGQYYSKRGLNPLLHGTDAEKYKGFADFQNNPKSDASTYSFGFSCPHADANKNTFTTEEFDKEEARRRRKNELL